MLGPGAPFETATSICGPTSRRTSHTLDGCGVSNAVILARDPTAEQIRAIQQHADRLTWAASTDIMAAGAADRFDRGRHGGRAGFGEMKFHLAADAPELARIRARRRPRRADPRALPGSAALRWRGRLRDGLQDVRGDAEGVSEDDVHGACGCVLGEHQRRLPNDAAIRPVRSRAAASPIICSATTGTSLETSRRTAATTRCRATPTLRANS